MFTDLFRMLTDFCQNPLLLAAFLTGVSITAIPFATFLWRTHGKKRKDRELLMLLCANRVSEPKKLPEYVRDSESKRTSLDQDCRRLSEDKRILERKLKMSKRSHGKILAEKDLTIADLEARIQAHVTTLPPQLAELARIREQLAGAERRIGELDRRVDEEQAKTAELLMRKGILEARLAEREESIVKLQTAFETERRKWEAEQKANVSIISSLRVQTGELQHKANLARVDAQRASQRVRELEEELRRSQAGKDNENGMARKKWESERQQLLASAEQWKAQADDLGGKFAGIELQNRHLQEDLKKAWGDKSNLESDLRKQKQEIARLSSLTKSQLQAAPAISSAGPIVTEVDRIWELSVAPAEKAVWVPRNRRTGPIIAVLNLKGGVGKTTVTANLGATRWASGQNVLLLDLDFQGTLTGRCLSDSQQQRLSHSPGSAHNFFQASGDPAKELLDRITQITLMLADGYREAMKPQIGRGWILGADEPLADVETAVMVRWLQQRGNAGADDVRFRLRKALHAATVHEKHQLVIMDCPPRLTTACVNALAASDHVLIPVLRDRASTERVPMLLKWLSQLHACGVCDNLVSVAVLANNTNENAEEREAWAELPGYCSAKLPFKLEFLESAIKHNTYFAHAAKRRYPAVLRKRQEFDSIRMDFSKLDQELQKRMP